MYVCLCSPLMTGSMQGFFHDEPFKREDISNQGGNVTFLILRWPLNLTGTLHDMNTKPDIALLCLSFVANLEMNTGSSPCTSEF